jgi:hypothetical protein
MIGPQTLELTIQLWQQLHYHTQPSLGVHFRASHEMTGRLRADDNTEVARALETRGECFALEVVEMLIECPGWCFEIEKWERSWRADRF